MDIDKSYQTKLIHYKEGGNGSVVPPIYQSSLFTFENWDSIDKAFDDPFNNSIYTRGNNPSVSLVEEKIAILCGGERAKLFSSGMGAISSAILHFVKNGEHIISIKNVYGPANNFMNVYLKEKCNIETTFIDGKDIKDFENSIKDNTKLIYLESPSSAVFSLQDIKKVVALAKKNNIKTIIDNTWATPIFQRPLEMGIDLEIHSCSKYIGGHSDVVAGVVVGKEIDIRSIFDREHAFLGAKLSPFEAWLILRSLRTLKIRMLQHQENAIAVANFLDEHPKIKKVLYPGIESFEQYQLAKEQMSGFSGLMGFIIDSNNIDEIKNFFNSLKYFRIGVSWGGHESLIYAPAISYLKEMPKEQFDNMGISLGVMRISVGLEEVNDLIDDLKQALKHIK
ncbi:trans-sulfuration enzyme family protein [Brachyspira aalborgi]|uniref:Aminotransferase class I/II-fold pyridoxal phosphate-dependent enzyme n=1 Tax=Brachyspira aalborgi TaxID=29522 RepID=A0A5C8CI66_9SPIR|nr:aminotransferase class I/II-fold pyridoxal phosphate-dependent enzyme [Brachyspira aalborgi]TXJ12717.1 aminotransferase class I/II-fold pyridoxal phosphate-dependent enzyme [Brachyspira aalborgi]